MIAHLLVLSALAQDVPDAPGLDLQRWSMPLDGRGTMWTWDASDAPRGWYTAGTALGWQRDPVVYRHEDGAQSSVVGSVLQTSVLGAWSAGRALIGAELPLLFGVRGEAIDTDAALGDVSMVVKGVLLDREAPVGVALLGRLRLPSTSGADTDWALDSASYELGLVADLELGGALIAMNLGTHGQPRGDFGDFAVDDALSARLGGAWRLDVPVSVGADVVAELPWSGTLSDVRTVPVEGLVNVSAQIAQHWSAAVGYGRGLTAGVGAPDARVVASFRYAPVRSWDRDLDGIADRGDACPDVPEDSDGYRDQDGCPDALTEVHLQLKSPAGEPLPAGAMTIDPGQHSGAGSLRLELAAGTYQAHAVAAGHEALDQTFDVPDGPPLELTLTLKAIQTGTLELIVLNPAQARIPEATWSVQGRTLPPMQGGVGVAELPIGLVELVASAPGYVSARFPVLVEAGDRQPLTVTLRPAKVVVTREKLVISEKVFFDTNRATIKAESLPLLDEVASVLLERADILSVRIEGHTDARGSDQTNLTLSDRRAASVRDHLLSKGVSAERLHAIGFGESRPLDDREVAAAWDLNRRVEFFIERWAE